MTRYVFTVCPVDSQFILLDILIPIVCMTQMLIQKADVKANRHESETYSLDSFQKAVGASKVIDQFTISRLIFS
jgi:hypothetical protein